MSGVSQQIVESLQHLPHGVENPVGAVASLAGAVILDRVMRVRYGQTEEQYAVEFSNPALLETSIRPDSKANRKDRLSSSRFEFIGAALLAAQLFGHPTYQTETVNNQANLVIVSETSNSTLQTHDLDPKLSRSQVVNQAVSASDYHGNLEFIQFGYNDFSVTIPATAKSNWRPYEPALDKPAVDSNGATVVGPLKQAAQDLRQANGEYKGSIILVTDGILSDSSNIGQEAAALNQANIKTQVIVEGADNAQYLMPVGDTKFSATPQPGNLSSFSNVKSAQTAAELTHDIQAAMHTAGTKHQKHTWWWPTVFGAPLFAYGFFKDKWQRAARKV